MCSRKMGDSKKIIKPPSDDFSIHCSKLGHQLTFSYCRSENMGTPCLKSLDCWFRYFPVENYLRSELTQQEWVDTFETPRSPKFVTLVDLIEIAKKEKS